MRKVSRCAAAGVWVVLVAAACCNAAPPTGDCPSAEVAEHVLRQMQRYLPMSETREYFGFVYSWGGRIDSAIVQGSTCPNPAVCGVDTRAAAARIPRAAKVLGEWHTHPRGGSKLLSADDVRGANANHRIRCYAAFYATSDGRMYRWNPEKTSVPTAMASREGLQLPAAVAADAQPNGLSSESTGVENQTGSSAPM
ncbi:MAG TPA: hypothetical protein VM146_19820 [Steroidobacteraceae bacterium]|nr:hypothetical protein [Steroidobacteraceae bacterium]